MRVTCCFFVSRNWKKKRKKMALCNLTRFVLQRRCFYTHRGLTNPLCATITETHDEKNMRLKRPMSPHLTIYQVQLTALLSITHRTTGLVLSGYAMVLGLGTLAVPGGIDCLIQAADNLALSSPTIFAVKSILALPATFHTFNGLRHLAWDMGMFLKIKQVYSTGYSVVFLSLISAILCGSL